MKRNAGVFRLVLIFLCAVHFIVPAGCGASKNDRPEAANDFGEVSKNVLIQDMDLATQDYAAETSSPIPSASEELTFEDYSEWFNKCGYIVRDIVAMDDSFKAYLGGGSRFAYLFNEHAAFFEGKYAGPDAYLIEFANEDECEAVYRKAGNAFKRNGLIGIVAIKGKPYATFIIKAFIAAKLGIENEDFEESAKQGIEPGDFAYEAFMRDELHASQAELSLEEYVGWFEECGYKAFLTDGMISDLYRDDIGGGSRFAAVYNGDHRDRQDGVLVEFASEEDFESAMEKTGGNILRNGMVGIVPYKGEPWISALQDAFLYAGRGRAAYDYASEARKAADNEEQR